MNNRHTITPRNPKEIRGDFPGARMRAKFLTAQGKRQKAFDLCK
jgi:hypothetical protein